MPTVVRGAERAKAEWLHWLYVRGDQAISCTIDACGDGFFVAALIPLWSSGDATIEMFRRPADALHWQEVVTRKLHAAGWLLVEGGNVTNAA